MSTSPRWRERIVRQGSQGTGVSTRFKSLNNIWKLRVPPDPVQSGKGSLETMVNGSEWLDWRGLAASWSLSPEKTPRKRGACERVSGPWKPQQGGHGRAPRAPRPPPPLCLCREPLFRQLCALHWLLEALTIDRTRHTMKPVITCWDPCRKGETMEGSHS